MILNIYSIKDNKVPAYTQLRTAPSDGVMIRNVKTIMDSELSGEFSKYPSDFDLYKVGTYDTDTGDVQADFGLVMNFQTIKEML